MSRTIAKNKIVQTLTVRLNKSQSQDVERLMEFTRHKTASGALVESAADYLEVCKDRDELREQLEKLQDEHNDLKFQITGGLEAWRNILEIVKEV